MREVKRRPVHQDSLDSSLEIRSSDSSNALGSCNQKELANLDHCFSVDFRSTTLLDDFFVAGPFTLVDKPLSEPPDSRMEPEQRLNETVRRRPQIVAAANMHEFMRDDRFELRVIQVVANVCG